MTEDQQHDTSGTDRIQALIASGSEIAGSAVGAALGFCAGEPAVAAAFGAAGTMAAMVLKRVGHEASKRLLGPREKMRVGGVLAIAAAEIDQRIRNGETLRSDGFFDATATSRSDAEEVAESTLLKSQREPEERKLQYMGRLLASIAFDSSISGPMAHQILKAAEALTYRQLCIMKLTVEKERFELHSGDYRGQKLFSKELYQILYECFDLYNRGFVNFGGEVAFGPTDVTPGRMMIQGLGVDLFNLMGLSIVPLDHLIPITAQLK